MVLEVVKRAPAAAGGQAEGAALAVVVAWLAVVALPAPVPVPAVAALPAAGALLAVVLLGLVRPEAPAVAQDLTAWAVVLPLALAVPLVWRRARVAWHWRAKPRPRDETVGAASAVAAVTAEREKTNARDGEEGDALARVAGSAAVALGGLVVRLVAGNCVATPSLVGEAWGSSSLVTLVAAGVAEPWGWEGPAVEERGRAMRPR